jgi:hypothetical protein
MQQSRAAVGVDRVSPLGLLAIQCGKVDNPTFASRPCARAVDEDAEDPRPQRGASLKTVDPLDDGQPGVLKLFGAGGRPAIERASRRRAGL